MGSGECGLRLVWYLISDVGGGWKRKSPLLFSGVFVLDVISLVFDIGVVKRAACAMGRL